MFDGPGSEDRAIAEAILVTPYLSLFQVRIEHYEPDNVTLIVTFDPVLTNDGRNYHGGALATFLDTAGAVAAFSNHDFNHGRSASTVSLHVQYIGRAATSDLRVSARVTRRARELIFIEITAQGDGDGRLVAQALQTYRIV
jgi:uncharacterized protein (TIGR00369 family)